MNMMMMMMVMMMVMVMMMIMVMMMMMMMMTIKQGPFQEMDDVDTIVYNDNRTKTVQLRPFQKKNLVR